MTAIVCAYLALAARKSHVHESASIQNPLAGAALGCLRLLSFLDL